jgi:hypothetical protein
LNSSRFMKLIGLITGFVFLNIIVLSPGMMGVEIGGDSALQTASGVTLLLTSSLALLYGSYVLLFRPPVVTPVKNIQSREDYIAALGHYKHVKALNNDIVLGIDQLERMEKKRIVLLDVLGQRFDVAELSYKKFVSVIHEVENLFYLNVRGVLNKLSVFDASGFSTSAGPPKSSTFSNRLVQEQTNLYNEYLASVSGYIGANEEILLKLDRLLLEISQLGSTDYKTIEDMPCMKEIDSLIKQTKFYQQ